MRRFELHRDRDDTEECGCDFVQILTDQNERFELHHVIPDDGAEHVPEPDCPCRPDIQRVEYDWIVIDHRDQDLVLERGP
jgi:hypothetical protein